MEQELKRRVSGASKENVMDYESSLLIEIFCLRMVFLCTSAFQKFFVIYCSIIVMRSFTNALVVRRLSIVFPLWIGGYHEVDERICG